MRIYAHTLVKNEENFLWFAVGSVIEHVDRVVIWDTGSTDATVEIIDELKKTYPDKISFREYGDVSSEGLSRARQEMLEVTDADWIVILDGDEVWWDDSLLKLVEKINKNECECIAVRTINPVGDIYHYLSESRGKYEIAGKKGHLNLRAISMNVPGLHLGGIYPKEAYLDEKGLPVQERKGLRFLDVGYLHLTHLLRTGSWDKVAGNRKIRHEIGLPFSRDYFYPEVFFKPHPDFVSSPWKKIPRQDFLLAAIETPLRKVKRILVR